MAFPDLGPEAIHRLEVEDLPTIVINDCHGGDLYELGRREYARVHLRMTENWFGNGFYYLT